MSILSQKIQEIKPAVEAELHMVLDGQFSGDCDELKYMMAYHMGWEGAGAGDDAHGKRIRPLLLLLSADACGGNWIDGLPAAASVEYLHNFSLIHDDIQDKSDLRRGRETLWKKWGLAQAVNAGDFMFTMSQLSILRLKETCSEKAAILSSEILQKASIMLTKGQYLDISYENRNEISLENYWTMIGGKTSSLLGCCSEIGAIVAGVKGSLREDMRNFAYTLGLAFQIQDDWLGIWGDSVITGKSVASDLVSGKKTFPIQYALTLKGAFSKRWFSGPILKEEVDEVAKMLADEGVKESTQQKTKDLTNSALTYLENSKISEESREALIEFAGLLMNRRQ